MGMKTRSGDPIVTRCERCDTDAQLMRTITITGVTRASYVCPCCQFPVSVYVGRAELEAHNLWIENLPLHRDNRQPLPEFRPCPHRHNYTPDYNRADARTASVNYPEYIQSPEWRRVSWAMKWFADNRCQLCGSTEDLNTHHNTYAHLGHERPQDLIVLCRTCHEYVTIHLLTVRVSE